MVTVSKVLLREGDNGKFVVLELHGDLTMIQSQNTGRFYATVKKCTIPCTFDPKTAQSMIGKQIQGSIIKEECDDYEFTVPETGEVMMLVHRYVYTPEEVSVTTNQHEFA